MAAILLLSVGLAAVPLLVWLPHRAWRGLDGFLALGCYQIFLVVTNLALSWMGAAAFLGVHYRRAWNARVVTSRDIQAIVRSEWLSRTRPGIALLATTLTFWLAWAFEVLSVNNAGPMASGESVCAGLRAAIFLLWLGARTLAHALPFVALGIAVSALTSRRSTAIALVFASQIGTGWLVYTAWSPLWSSLSSGDLLSSLLSWPVDPNRWQGYSSSGYLPCNWWMDCIADTVWIVAIPWLFYCIAVRVCRRRAGV